MMPMIDEATRHALHDYFISQMGEDLAAVFMNLLSTVAWGDLATKHDVAALKYDVVALKEDVAVLKMEIGALREDIGGDMTALEVRLNERLDDKLAATEAGLRTEMHQGFRRMTVWVASLQVVTLGAVAALTRLG